MTELNLPFIRYVRQVSNGMARSKYSYLAMQDDLLKELQKGTWKLATCATNNITTVTNKVAKTDEIRDEDGNITKAASYTAYIDDRYDAYKQGGDANTTTATMCGYAGMVAYRFALPTNQSSNIQEIRLKFSSSRYLRSGLKVVAVLNNSATPSDDWEVIRGTASSTSGQVVAASTSTVSTADGVKSWGVLSQDVPTLMDSRAAEGTFTFDTTHYSQIGTSTRFTYLWVYVSIEDYTDYWLYYDDNTPRFYSIEGSATLVASMCSVVFAGAETSVPTTHTMDIVKNGIVPSVWDTDTSKGAQVYHVTVQRNGDPIADGNLERIVDEITRQGGTINRVDILPVLGYAGSSASTNSAIQFAVICGKGFKGTFPNIDGMLFYDCEGKRLVNPSSVALPMTQKSRDALDDETYHYGIVRCLMNYEQGRGFYFMPCVGNHVTENRLSEEVYYYEMIKDQVTPIRPDSQKNTFYYFNYDKANNMLVNVQAREHLYLYLGGTELIALPGMVPDREWVRSVNKEISWIGVRRGRVSSNSIYIETLLYYDSNGTQPWHYTFFKGYPMRLNSQTGVIVDVVTLPFSVCCPENGTEQWPKYRGCFGVQVTGGEVNFGYNCSLYDNTYIHNYTSTFDCDSSVKVMVATRPDGGSGNAESMECLNSSIEMAGITLNENAQVTHAAPTLKNKVITGATQSQFAICKIDQKPIRVNNTFQVDSLSYPENTNWLTEFADGTSIWAQKNEATFTVDKGSTIVNEEYNLADSAEGLRVCYGKFFTGQAVPLGGLTSRIGVACNLVGSTTVQAPDQAGTMTLNCWQLVQSSLVIPFGCPRTWKAKQVKLDWTNWTGSATDGSKIFVWLARDQFIMTHPEFLGKLQISTGGTVSGCELVGEIDPTTNVKNKTFNIQDLAAPTATLILTAFIDMDDINPSGSTWTKKGVGDLALNMKSMELTGMDKCMIPNIQLLG